ncbi:MAG: DUF4292 domain-containing protein [Tenuifilaceae bacterium]|nr:DUF4292 domain-containing protein [Tenuifilaceae bacterium]
MYPNRIYLVSVIIFFIWSCSSKPPVTSSLTTNIDHNTQIITSQFERTILRIETDGHLRTHRANLTSARDEFVVITIFSNLRKPLATVVFDTLGLKIIDIHQNFGFDFSYHNLHKAIGVPLNIQSVQRILFGAYDISVKDSPNFVSNFLGKTHPAYEVDARYSFNSFNRLEFISLENLSNGKVLHINFFYRKTPVFPMPDVTHIQIEFNNQPMEFELEFDKKHFILNAPVSLQYDTLVPLQIMNNENE